MFFLDMEQMVMIFQCWTKLAASEDVVPEQGIMTVHQILAKVVRFS